MPENEYQGGALRALEQGTYNKDEGELLWWSYYDTADLLAATTTHDFFNTPVGGAKQLNKTNWGAASQMPQGQNFEVKAFELYYIPSAAKTQATYQHVLDMFKNSYFQFSVFSKGPSLQLPLTQFMGNSFPAVVGGAAAGDQLQSRASWSGIWESPIEIPLGAKANIECSIKMVTPGNASLDGDQIKLCMVGGLIRL